MTYNELQKKAADLGMEKVVGKSKEELESFIDSNSSKDSSPKESSNKKESSEPEYNTAVVFDGTREVRRYSLENHGDMFADLAEEFASSRGYRIEMRVSEPATLCPHCGFKITID